MNKTNDNHPYAGTNGVLMGEDERGDEGNERIDWRMNVCRIGSEE